MLLMFASFLQASKNFCTFWQSRDLQTSNYQFLKQLQFRARVNILATWLQNLKNVIQQNFEAVTGATFEISVWFNIKYVVHLTKLIDYYLMLN